MIVVERLARVDGRDHHIEEPVVVEVVRRSRHRRSVTVPSRPRDGATSTNRPISLRFESRWWDQVTFWYLIRILANRHVGDVEEPPHFEVIGGFESRYFVKYSVRAAPEVFHACRRR